MHFPKIASLQTVSGSDRGNQYYCRDFNRLNIRKL